MRTIYLILLSMMMIFFMIFTVQAQTVFINEIHYDNDGTDSDEGVELAGPAGTNLESWQIIPYNGNGGATYSPDTVITMTVIPDQDGGYGTVWFPIPGLQNGAPDGVALVDPTGSVIQFLSYEGSFTATNGPAAGLTSTDIGVSEPSNSALGNSIQLSGTGTTYTDFIWNSPANNTYGAVNTNQYFQAITNTIVKFSINNATVGEGDGFYDLVVIIENPDDFSETTAEVVLISGDPADINNYTTQTVTFPEASAENQIVSITVTDDSEVEGNETITFELQNVQGGNNAQIGLPSQFNLTIEENDFAPVPLIVVNEIMQNPNTVADNDGEWFEIYNADNMMVDINGWTITDNGTDSHLIDNGGPLTIDPGDYLVLGINDTLTVNGGVLVDYVYSSFFLGNSDDEIILIYSDGVSVVDRVDYDGGPNFPDPTGKSMELNNPDNDNSIGTNWAEAITQYGDGDYGTPGAQNSTFVSGLESIEDYESNMNFRLHGNFPNPFNPSTTLRFEIPNFTDKFNLAIYNVSGQKVSTLHQGAIQRGKYEYVWDGTNHFDQPMPSGIYFAVMKTKGSSKSVKMMLIK